MIDIIKEILSKAKGKPLPSYITLLTGLPLFIWLLNEFGNINVKTDFLDFFVFDGDSTPKPFIIVMLVVIIAHLLINLLGHKIICKCLDENTGKIRNRRRLLFYFTIENVLDVLSATATLLLAIILQNDGIKIDCLKYIVALLIIFKFLHCIYNHYYTQNQKMANEYLKE